jgi:hypothetical protein
MAQPPPATPPPPPRKWKWHDYNPTTKDQASGWWKHYCESINKGPSIFQKATAPVTDIAIFNFDDNPHIDWKIWEDVPQIVHGASGLPRSRL